MPVLERKVEANSFLPRLAFAYLRGELHFAQLVAFFKHYQHLYTIGIDTNAICNLDCGYCYLDRYRLKKGDAYTPLDAFKQTVRYLAQIGIDLIALVGKEPFADSRGSDLLQHLAELRNEGTPFRFGVVTNGTLVHRYIDRIPSSIDYIDISLDGPKEINDRTRGRGVYDRATTNARLLLKHGFELWISGVLHQGVAARGVLRTFVSDLVETHGITKFYFSPVRNFTGNLHPFLLTYAEIASVQDELVDIAEKVRGVDLIVLDHPYEAVWRDYFFRYATDPDSVLDRLRVDGFGVVFEPLSKHSIRKLDIFPHSPWGTARIDAFGNYLADVEARTYEEPPTVGNIGDSALSALRSDSVQLFLEPMLSSFLKNMEAACGAAFTDRALLSASMPQGSLYSANWRHAAIKAV